MKSLKGFVFAILAISLAGALGSAYGYYENPNYYPYWNSSTTHINNQLDIDSNLKQTQQVYSRNYVGPVIERQSKYTETYVRNRGGDVIYQVISKTSENAIGESENEYANTANFDSSQKISQSQNLVFPTRTYSNWRYKTKYDPDFYEPETYQDYYYKPRFESSSNYYNWRY